MRKPAPVCPAAEKGADSAPVPALIAPLSSTGQRQEQAEVQ